MTDGELQDKWPGLTVGMPGGLLLFDPDYLSKISVWLSDTLGKGAHLSEYVRHDKDWDGAYARLDTVLEEMRDALNVKPEEVRDE